jgi:FkbM family methyltransferase
MPLTRSAYGWVLPGSDRHFSGYLANAPKVEGRRMYQPQHIRTALSRCTQRRVAADVGAHVGFWSYYLAFAFGRVHAFEPANLMCHCFELNVRAKNVQLHRVALGAHQGRVASELVPDNTGASFVRESGEGGVTLKTLDDYALDELDLLKVDVEGYERFVLEGARETLLRCRPVVIIEQKSFSERYGVEQFAALEYLQSLGASVLDQVVNDFVLGWPATTEPARP